MFHRIETLINNKQSSDDYDIFQNAHSFTFRQYFENLNNENFEFDTISFSFSSTSLFRAYEFSIKRFSFQTSFFEKVLQQKKQREKFFLIHLILNLYFERTKKFRANYVKLKKMLQIIEKTFTKKQKNSMLNLSLKLNIFKRQIKRHISLLRVFRKIITIIIEKQLSLAARKKSARRQKIERLF